MTGERGPRLAYRCASDTHRERVHFVSAVHLTGDAWTLPTVLCGHPEHGPDPAFWPEMARVEVAEDSAPPTTQPEVIPRALCDEHGVPLDWERCRVCRGSQVIHTDKPGLTSPRPCPRCGGHGSLHAAALAHCAEKQRHAA